MLTPGYYDHLTDELVKLYAELDNAIISDITRRIVKNGYLTESAKWQIQQLQESGMMYDDIIAEISKHTNATDKQLRTIFEDAGLQSISNDNAAYNLAGLGSIIKMSPAALQVLNAGFKKCAGTLSNLTLTTANTGQTAYITACNNAYMQITSGAFDYQTAIRHAVKQVAESGTEVLYPSGHSDKIDVAVRRAVLTGVGQTCRTLSETNAQDMGCDLMEITAHAGARPSHAEWQGQIVSLSGRKGYLSKSDIGYGTGDGFGGWNCRHDWYPFFEGISKRSYTKNDLKDLNARNIEYQGKKYTEYEISQIQRAFERKIRGLKREAAAYQTAIQNASSDTVKTAFEEDFKNVSVKLKAKEKELGSFINKTGQLRDPFREQANGFGRSTAQKAVWANKSTLTSGTGSGTIKLRSKNNNHSNVKKISDEKFDNLIIEVKKHGAVVLRGTEEVEKHLTNMGADAANIGDVLMFRQDVCISEVLEETYHFMQNKNNMNVDKSEPLRTYLNEIDAKQYLLDNAKKYKIPRSETETTQKQLDEYKDALKRYRKENK